MKNLLKKSQNNMKKVKKVNKCTGSKVKANLQSIKSFGKKFESLKHYGNPKDFPKNWDKTREQIIDNFVVSGVPFSLLKQMCKEANISYPKLKKWLGGQTCALVGNETLIYPWDIKRFISNSLIWD